MLVQQPVPVLSNPAVFIVSSEFCLTRQIQDGIVSVSFHIVAVMNAVVLRGALEFCNAPQTHKVLRTSLCETASGAATSRLMIPS